MFLWAFLVKALICLWKYRIKHVKKIGVNATLTFLTEGHLQGHKVCALFDIIWTAIVGQWRPTLLHND